MSRSPAGSAPTPLEDLGPGHSGAFFYLTTITMMMMSKMSPILMPILVRAVKGSNSNQPSQYQE